MLRLGALPALPQQFPFQSKFSLKLIVWHRLAGVWWFDWLLDWCCPNCITNHKSASRSRSGRTKAKAEKPRPKTKRKRKPKLNLKLKNRNQNRIKLFLRSSQVQSPTTSTSCCAFWMRERSRTRTLSWTGSRPKRERDSRVDRKLSLLISFGLTSTSCCLSHLRSSCSCANYYLLILISLSSPVVIPSAMPQATDRRTLALALALTFISGASSWRQPGRVHFTSPKHTLNPHSTLPRLWTVDKSKCAPNHAWVRASLP